MKKNQKPTEIDVYLKYVCPKNNCTNDHWLSLKEAKVKNFKIVCDSGCVFSPKPINKIKISYDHHTTKPIVPEISITQEIPEPVEEKETIEQIRDRFIDTIKQLGFEDENESSDMFYKVFDTCPTDNVTQLIKLAILELT